jgi:decaprenylphospho-beta-D-erythro-pentofuranosid-2-ulose 2-reductase
VSDSSRSLGRRVVVAGGTSEIALAIVRALEAQSPREVMLLGRDPGSLERAAQQLREAGCERVLVAPLEAALVDDHGRIVREAIARLGGADIVILAIGKLTDEGGAPADPAAALEVLRVNFLGTGSLLLHFASALREARGGALVVLSSVAAQRPRRANPVYGASKAGLDALAQGLGDALWEEGVRVLVVRAGFVRTRMTRGMPAAPLATSPEAVAAVVVRGLARGAHTVWAPRAVRWLMLAVRLLPRPLMRRIKQ